MSRIIAFGEILWDISEYSKDIGGAPFNFLSHTAKLGADSYLCSAIGEDDLGTETIKIIKDRNVKTDFLNASKLQTGVCNVTLNEDKSASYDLKRPVAYDEIKPDVKNIKNFDVLYFGTLCQRSENNRKALDEILSNCNFKEIICDVNLRDGQYDKDSVLKCLNNATILKLNDEELMPVCEFANCESDVFALGQRYKNIKIILYTMGADGSKIFDIEKNEAIEIPPVYVDKVVSTVGAGDSYAAAFVYYYTERCSLKECGDKAALVSGDVITKHGAI